MKRRVTLRSLAKLNLDLRILHKRADGFHELRTVFQTISLADTIAVEFESLRLKTARTSIEVEASAGGKALDIPDNLIVSAARAVLDAAKVKARVRFKLEKIIPMGGGLGGGSSNAAAVLLALPVLAGRVLAYEKLMELGAALGSDVPFFLEGGTALAVDRGTEIYGLPDVAEEPILVIASGIHVATGAAYRTLGRGFLGDMAPKKPDGRSVARGDAASGHDSITTSHESGDFVVPWLRPGVMGEYFQEDKLASPGSSPDAGRAGEEKLESVSSFRQAPPVAGGRGISNPTLVENPLHYDEGAPGLKLTSLDLSRKINNFQNFVRALSDMRSAKAASAFSANDFEPVVFGQHPQLKLLAARLRTMAGKGGAVGARMTGSGSALFAIFGSKAERDAVLASVEASLKKDRVFGGCRVIPAGLVSRRSFQRMWRRQLAEHVVSGDSLWPPQSRHAR